MKKEQMVIELEKLKPNPANPRTHSDDQIREIGRSLDKFGQFRPIVVDTSYMILAGHGLFEAMKLKGLSQAEVMRYTGLSDGDKKKLLLADNKTQSLGKDDFDAITALIRDIDDDYIPGYDADILAAIRAQDEVDQNIIDEAGEAFDQDYTPEDGVDTFGGASTEEPDEQPAAEAEVDEDGCLVCPNCGEKVCPQ